MKYTVRIARDLVEYADVEVEAENEEEAEDIINDRINGNELDEDALKWFAGADREGPYVVDTF